MIRSGKNSALVAKLVISILSLAVVSFSTTEPAQAKPLNGKQVLAAISGNSFSFTGPYSGAVQFKSGGTVSYKLTTGQSATGKWWIKASRYCTKYPNRKTKCYGMNSKGYGSYKTTGGYTLKRR